MMAGAETRAEVKRVLEKYQHLVMSMVADQDKTDDATVELWWALSKADREIEVLRKYAEGLRARLEVE